MFFKKEQETRKFNSEQILLSYNLPVNHELPYSDTEKFLRIRTPEETLYRALSMIPICIKTINNDDSEENFSNTIGNLFKLGPHLTPAEIKYMMDKNPSKDIWIPLTWRLQSIYTLLWVLGFIPYLNRPHSENDFQLENIIHILFSMGKDPNIYLSKANFRTKKELLDELDLYYRLHIACSEARFYNEDISQKISEDMVYERHYALSWVTCQRNEEWDDITLLNG